MTTAAVLAALLQYGPSIIPLISQLTTWIKDGKKEVTADDFAILVAYGKKTSADYLRDAGLQIVDGKVVPL